MENTKEIRNEESMNLKNQKGQLVKFFKEKGYGFLKHEGREVFVHTTAYLSGFFPEVGQIVGFDFALGLNNKPPMAVNIRVLKSAQSVKDEQEIKAGLEALERIKISRVADTVVVTTEDGAV